jgi:ATP-dependent Clp protease protease subunit
MSVKVDKDKRRIILNDDIDNSTTMELIEGLLDIEDEEDRDPIDLYITTPGGSAYQLIGLYDVIQSLNSKVNTYGIGRVMSAGVYLLMCGTGKRYTYPNTRFMMHGAQSGIHYQSYKDLEIRHEEIQNIQSSIENLVTKHTNKKLEDVREDMERDLFMTAEDALSYGIIDEIIRGGE